MPREGGALELRRARVIAVAAGEYVDWI